MASVWAHNFGFGVPLALIPAVNHHLYIHENTIIIIFGGNKFVDDRENEIIKYFKLPIGHNGSASGDYF